MIEPTSVSASDVADASTFEAFFLAQHERLLQALYLLTGDRFEADDLAQDAVNGEVAYRREAAADLVSG